MTNKDLKKLIRDIDYIIRKEKRRIEEGDKKMSYTKCSGKGKGKKGKKK